MRDEKLHNSCISWLLNWANTNKPDMILIYGSYLRRKESHDIDVLIVSDEFCSIDNKKRRELIPIPDIYQDLFDILLMSSYEWKKKYRSQKSSEHFYSSII